MVRVSPSSETGEAFRTSDPFAGAVFSRVSTTCFQARCRAAGATGAVRGAVAWLAIAGWAGAVCAAAGWAGAEG